MPDAPLAPTPPPHPAYRARGALRRAVDAVVRRFEGGDARYRRLFMGSAAAQLLVEPEQGIVVEANARAAALYGRERDALVGLPLGALDAGDPRELLVALRNAVSATVAPALLRRMRNASRAPRDVEIYPGEARLGGRTLLHLVLHDVTDRCRLERERAANEEMLRESQLLFQRMSEASPDIVYLWDVLTRRSIFSNRILAEVLGYSKEEREGTDDLYTSLIHPDDLAGVAVHHHRLTTASDTDVLVCEYRVRHRDGHHRWLQSRDVVFARSDDGAPRLVLGVATDITESREAAERLALSEARASLLAQQAPVGIFQADARGEFTFVNERFAAMVGMAPRELLGSGWLRALHGRDRARVLGAWTAAQRARRDFHLEFRMRSTDAQVHWVVATAQPAPDGGWLGSVTDITLLKETERALILARDAAEQASQAKTDFLNRMSHELRTPLTAVIGFARLLNHSARARLTPQEQGFMERIDANAQHLLGLITNILDLAKLDAGKLQVELEPVELGRLAADTLASLEGAVGARRIELRTEVPPGLAPVMTDPGRLRQVLINLIGNALKFTEHGSVTVAIEADAAGHPRRLHVRDTGIGIPRERQAAIFEAFEQGDNGTTRRFGGTGLGLAISKEICELLGASLRVASEEGRGTTFTIEFAPPAHAEPAAA